MIAIAARCDSRLRIAQAVLAIAMHRCAQRVERLHRATRCRVLTRRAATRSCRSCLLALDHARVRVAVAADAQPVATDPDPVARDHRLAGRQPRPQRQRLGRSRRRRCRRTAPRARPGPARAHAGTRRADASAARLALPAAKKRHGAGVQAAEHPATASIVDADGLEVVAERGLDRALPARSTRAAARAAALPASPRDLSHSTTCALRLARAPPAAGPRATRSPSRLQRLATRGLRGFGQLALAAARSACSCRDAVPRRCDAPSSTAAARLLLPAARLAASCADDVRRRQRVALLAGARAG